jgi:hypothetical protein
MPRRATSRGRTPDRVSISFTPHDHEPSRRNSISCESSFLPAQTRVRQRASSILTLSPFWPGLQADGLFWRGRVRPHKTAVDRAACHICAARAGREPAPVRRPRPVARVLLISMQQRHSRTIGKQKRARDIDKEHAGSGTITIRRSPGRSNNNEKTLLHTSKRPTTPRKRGFFCRPIVGETSAADKRRNRAPAEKRGSQMAASWT